MIFDIGLDGAKAQWSILRTYTEEILSSAELHREKLLAWITTGDRLSGTNSAKPNRLQRRNPHQVLNYLCGPLCLLWISSVKVL